MSPKHKPDMDKKEIHLVDSSSASSHSEDTRLTVGPYQADIISSKTDDRCCYYVLQRAGSAEIIEMERFDTPHAARAAATSALERWNQA